MKTRKTKPISFSALLIALLAFFLSCGDLDRSNPLDPKNPQAKRSRTVLVEAFVNAQGGTVMQAAMDGLARLSRDFGSDAFILLEHHVQKTPNTDALADEASLTRYYLLARIASEQAIPDVFFDGRASRIQGASDAEIAYLRYRAELEDRLAIPAQVTVEAEAHLEGDKMIVSADIAKLGLAAVENVATSIAVVGGLQNSNQAVVREMLPAEAIGSLHSDVIRNIRKEVPMQASWNQSTLAVVVIVERASDQLVYHCASVPLTR